MERFERALLLSDFKLENIIHGVTSPSIRISFIISNVSKGKNYTILPAQCIIRSFYNEIIRTNIFPSSGQWFTGKSEAKPIAGTYLASTSS